MKGLYYFTYIRFSSINQQTDTIPPWHHQYWAIPLDVAVSTSYILELNDTQNRTKRKANQNVREIHSMRNRTLWKHSCSQYMVDWQNKGIAAALTLLANAPTSVYRLRVLYLLLFCYLNRNGKDERKCNANPSNHNRTHPLLHYRLWVYKMCTLCWVCLNLSNPFFLYQYFSFRYLNFTMMLRFYGYVWDKYCCILWLIYREELKEYVKVLEYAICKKNLCNFRGRPYMT